MNAHIRTIPFDLNNHAQSYDLDADKFRIFKNAAVEKIIAYDEKFGHYLLEHLNRTSTNLKKFLIFGDYAEDTAHKISNAFWFHDLGKVKQNISIWEHTSEKPGAEKKALRQEHTSLGKVAIQEIIEETRIELDTNDQAHVGMIIYLMESHHERVNGIGPLKMTRQMMDVPLMMAAVIDEVDGKIKLDHETHTEIFNDLTTRHSEKFDPIIVQSYERFCRENRVLADLGQLREAAFQYLPQ